MKQEMMLSISGMTMGKQVWKKLGLSKFLQLWAKETKVRIDGFERLPLYNFETVKACGNNRRIYLQRDSAKLFVDKFDGADWSSHYSYTAIDRIHDRHIDQIINAINDKLEIYFRDMASSQARCDENARIIWQLVEDMRRRVSSI